MIICIAAVLLIAAIWGTVAFVRGNKNASAASPDNNLSTSQADGTSAGTDNNGSQSNDNNQNPSVLPNTGEDGSSNNTGANNSGSSTNSNNSNATNNTGTSNSNNSGTGNNAGTTTTVNNSQNVPNQEYTQTTVIPGRENVLEYQSTQIGWNPIKIEADTSTSELKVYRPIITGEKKVNKTEVKAGEELTYTIILKNSGNATGSVTVVDPIPAGTIIADENTQGYDKESNSMIWNVELKAGDEIELTFVVRVEDITKTTIKNVATIDGEEIPDKPTTKIAHITTTKTSTPSKTPLHELDTITYTLAATNDGTGAGSVKIADTIPVGTSLVGDIKIGGKTYTVDDLNKGIEVELNAGESKSIVFTVQVNPFKSGYENVEEKDGRTIRTIRNAEATQDGKEVPPTEDTVEKEYVSITAKKEWNDADNAEGKRKEVTFRLYADGKDTGKPATASKSTNWVANFGDKFDKYDADKKEIKYTIKEDTTPDGYKTNNQEVGNGGTITNVLDFSQFTKQITVTKIWEDNKNGKLNESDKKGPRPDSIDIIFKGSDKSEIPETLTASPVAKDSEPIWSKTYTLPKYDSKGNEITYTVDEEPIDYYVQTSKVVSDDKSNVTITNAIPNLKIEKTVSTINGKTAKTGDTVKEGDIVGYDITVTNIGTVKLENITVTDVMANKGAIFTKYDDEKSTVKNGVITSSLTLDVDAHESYTVYYKVTADDVKDVSKKINNTATAKVTYKDENKTDRTIERDATASINPTANADISIKKEQKIGNVSVDKEGKTSAGKQIKVEPNTKITYTVTVVNKGNTVQKDVVVTDEMTKKSDANYTIKSVKVNGSDRKYTQKDSKISIGDLGIGQTAVITIEYTVDSGDMSENEEIIKNTVSVNKEDKNGKAPTDKVKVSTEKWKTDIDVVKSSKLYRDGKEISGPAIYGDIIKYTITATNKGKKAGKVNVKDTVPSGTKLIKTAGTNLSETELEALDSKTGLSKDLTVKGKNGTTNGTASIYFEVKVIAQSATKNIKNTATIDDKEEKSDKGYDVEKKAAVKKQTTTTTITNSNVVIVLDVSGSMNDGKFLFWGESKLEKAKKVIGDFANQMSFEKDGTGSALSIVTFSGDSYSDTSGTEYTNVLGVTSATGNNKDTVANTPEKAKYLINKSLKKVKADGGTCISGALTRAKEQVEVLKGKNSKNKNIVIFIGDGKPDGDAGDIPTEAKALKDTGATVYAIGFTQDVSILKNTVASSPDKYYTTNDNIDLSDVFKEISEEISPTEAVSMTSDNGKITLTDLDTAKDITIRYKSENDTQFKTVTGKYGSKEIGDKIILENGVYKLDTTKFDADATIEIDYISKTTK